MKFISPKIDYTFKKIFGSQQSQEILISFLNAIIYEGQNIIQSLTIVNPYNLGELMTLKETFLDVKAVLADGSIVAIEIQVASMAAFEKQMAYSLTKTYAHQVQKDEDFLYLNPAIAVTITDFIISDKTEDVISNLFFQSRKYDIAFLEKEFQLFVVELPKFKKALSELATLTDKWIYFIKEAGSLDRIPENLGEVLEIALALNLANQANMTVEELELLDRRGMMLQDEKVRIASAKEEARKEGQLAGVIAVIKRQLKKRFGEIPATISSRIEDLRLSHLEQLTEDIFELENWQDLSHWLEKNKR